MRFLKWVFGLVMFVVLLGLIARYYFKVNPPISISYVFDQSSFPLDCLSVPKGFTIQIFADSVVDARSMVYSSNGTLFVSTKSEGKVYALRDKNGDFMVDERFIILEDGNMPNGVAMKGKDLYVAEVHRVLKFEDIEANLSKPPKPKVIFDQFPTEKHHGWKYIHFGPDGKLYVPVGAPCNICLSENKVFASLTRMNDDGSGFEIVQEGIRNTVGFDWHPITKELWFTDNGRDLMGDDVPECELNHAKKDYQHFGYPYCHQGDVEDPAFENSKKCSEFIDPATKLGAHTAPLGMKFYTGNQFPPSYKNHIFVARHGSWNRSVKNGYDVVDIALDSNGVVMSVQPLVEGWLSADKKVVRGRPVAILELPDGSVLISDDFADVIYRLTYSKD